MNADELAVTIPAPRHAQSAMPQPASGANPDAPVPFVFGDEIARGGMGSILKADDCKLGRVIAVKIMLSELNADEDHKQRFINEAGVLARLAHPNIVPVYDIGRDSEGQLYYTMKLVKGRTLQAVINDLRDEGVVGCQPSVPSQSTVGRLPTTPHYSLAHLLTIFRKVCDAMALAHSQGIIHHGG